MSSTRDFKNPGIFADAATTVIPPTPIHGVAYRDAVNGTDDTPNGWRYGTRVESQDWNQVMFLLTSMMGMMDSQGVLGWSDQVEYAVPALVFGSDGLPYIALQASGPSTAAQDPVSAPTFWEQFALHGRQVFTASGTFTVPMSMQLGYVRPFVKVIGGGGGGAGKNSAPGPGGGGGGGIAERLVNLTGVSSVTVTVGLGGVGGVLPSNDGATGGTSSFGSFASASGGGGGFASGQAGGGGTGSLGDTNSTLGAGGLSFRDGSDTVPAGGYGGGGSSPGGFGGSSSAPFGPGQGGGGRTTINGVNGANGIIIIEW